MEPERSLTLNYQLTHTTLKKNVELLKHSVRQLVIKVLNIIDARCNHEVH